MKWSSGDILPLVTIEATATGSVLLRISTSTHRSSPNSNYEVGILAHERGQQRRTFDLLLQLLVQLCFELRRGNLENIAQLIPASINEQLKCEVGILGCERGKQRRSFDRLLQLLVQLCFGLRRGNSENFVKAIPTILCRVYLILDEIAKWGYSPAREDNKDGPSTDFYSY
ncbi:hypothetical protein HZH68_010976 [Vespula germanica]|uniref:Uncharacterized protein n=1 Tax=Vespula germanica TaxID=30212 RepID=A0A834JMP8_VESGE|nr:hypothetical protein HZH68_010976 [Vespula germanica]